MEASSRLYNSVQQLSNLSLWWKYALMTLHIKFSTSIWHRISGWISLWLVLAILAVWQIWYHWWLKSFWNIIMDSFSLWWAHPLNSVQLIFLMTNWSISHMTFFNCDCDNRCQYFSSSCAILSKYPNATCLRKGKSTTSVVLLIRKSAEPNLISMTAHLLKKHTVFWSCTKNTGRLKQRGWRGNPTFSSIAVRPAEKWRITTGILERMWNGALTTNQPHDICKKWTCGICHIWRSLIICICGDRGCSLLVVQGWLRFSSQNKLEWEVFLSDDQQCENFDRLRDPSDSYQYSSSRDSHIALKRYSSHKITLHYPRILWKCQL